MFISLEDLNNSIKFNFDEYKPHQKQKLFHDAGKKAFKRLFLGGNRTGKTYSTSIEISMHLTGNYPKWWEGYRYDKAVNVWVAGETNAETFQTVKQYYIGDGYNKGNILHNKIVSENKAYHIYYIKHSSGEISTLRFKSYEQGRARFQGAKVDIIHLDEEPPLNIVTECLMRLINTGDNKKKMLLLSMTPLLGNTNLIKSFIDSQHEGEIKDDKFFIRVSWDDAKHLSKEEKIKNRKHIAPHELEAREKGIAFIGTGLVYPVNLSAMLIEPFNIPNTYCNFFALDFGWENPTAALIFAYDRNNDIIYITGEYYQNKKTPMQHVYAFENLKINNMLCVYDPAGQSSSQADGNNLVELYKKAGLKNMLKADNSVESGVQITLERMLDNKIKIFNNLNYFISEFSSYSRKEDGKINKKNDHLMDCLRYGIVTGIKNVKFQNYNKRNNIFNDYQFETKETYFGI